MGVKYVISSLSRNDDSCYLTVETQRLSHRLFSVDRREVLVLDGLLYEYYTVIQALCFTSVVSQQGSIASTVASVPIYTYQRHYGQRNACSISET
jgi:hypothetical protein